MQARLKKWVLRRLEPYFGAALIGEADLDRLNVSVGADSFVLQDVELAVRPDKDGAEKRDAQAHVDSCAEKHEIEQDAGLSVAWKSVPWQQSLLVYLYHQLGLPLIPRRVRFDELRLDVPWRAVYGGASIQLRLVGLQVELDEISEHLEEMLLQHLQTPQYQQAMRLQRRLHTLQLVRAAERAAQEQSESGTKPKKQSGWLVSLLRRLRSFALSVLLPHAVRIVERMSIEVVNASIRLRFGDATTLLLGFERLGTTSSADGGPSEASGLHVGPSLVQEQLVPAKLTKRLELCKLMAVSSFARETETEIKGASDMDIADAGKCRASEELLQHEPETEPIMGPLNVRMSFALLESATSIEAGRTPAISDEKGLFERVTCDAIVEPFEMVCTDRDISALLRFHSRSTRTTLRRSNFEHGRPTLTHENFDATSWWSYAYCAVRAALRHSPKHATALTEAGVKQAGQDRRTFLRLLTRNSLKRGGTQATADAEAGATDGLSLDEESKLFEIESRTPAFQLAVFRSLVRRELRIQQSVSQIVGLKGSSMSRYKQEEGGTLSAHNLEESYREILSYCTDAEDIQIRDPGVPFNAGASESTASAMSLSLSVLMQRIAVKVQARTGRLRAGNSLELCLNSVSLKAHADPNVLTATCELTQCCLDYHSSSTKTIRVLQCGGGHDEVDGDGIDTEYLSVGFSACDSLLSSTTSKTWTAKFHGFIPPIRLQADFRACLPLFEMYNALALMNTASIVTAPSAIDDLVMETTPDGRNVGDDKPVIVGNPPEAALVESQSSADAFLGISGCLTLSQMEICAGDRKAGEVVFLAANATVHVSHDCENSDHGGDNGAAMKHWAGLQISRIGICLKDPAFCEGSERIEQTSRKVSTLVHPFALELGCDRGMQVVEVSLSPVEAELHLSVVPRVIEILNVCAANANMPPTLVAVTASETSVPLGPDKELVRPRSMCVRAVISRVAITVVDAESATPLDIHLAILDLQISMSSDQSGRTQAGARIKHISLVDRRSRANALEAENSRWWDGSILDLEAPREGLSSDLYSSFDISGSSGGTFRACMALDIVWYDTFAFGKPSPEISARLGTVAIAVDTASLNQYVAFFSQWSNQMASQFTQQGQVLPSSSASSSPESSALAAAAAAAAAPVPTQTSLEQPLLVNFDLARLDIILGEEKQRGVGLCVERLQVVYEKSGNVAKSDPSRNGGFLVESEDTDVRASTEVLQANIEALSVHDHTRHKGLYPRVLDLSRPTSSLDSSMSFETMAEGDARVQRTKFDSNKCALHALVFMKSNHSDVQVTLGRVRAAFVMRFVSFLTRMMGTVGKHPTSIESQGQDQAAATPPSAHDATAKSMAISVNTGPFLIELPQGAHMRDAVLLSGHATRIRLLPEIANKLDLLASKRQEISQLYQQGESSGSAVLGSQLSIDCVKISGAVRFSLHESLLNGSDRQRREHPQTCHVRFLTNMNVQMQVHSVAGCRASFTGVALRVNELHVMLSSEQLAALLAVGQHNIMYDPNLFAATSQRGNVDWFGTELSLDDVQIELVQHSHGNGKDLLPLASVALRGLRVVDSATSRAEDVAGAVTTYHERTHIGVHSIAIRDSRNGVYTPFRTVILSRPVRRGGTPLKYASGDSERSVMQGPAAALNEIERDRVPDLLLTGAERVTPARGYELALAVELDMWGGGPEMNIAAKLDFGRLFVSLSTDFMLLLVDFLQPPSPQDNQATAAGPMDIKDAKAIDLVDEPVPVVVQTHGTVEVKLGLRLELWFNADPFDPRSSALLCRAPVALCLQIADPPRSIPDFQLDMSKTLISFCPPGVFTTTASNNSFSSATKAGGGALNLDWQSSSASVSGASRATTALSGASRLTHYTACLGARMSPIPIVRITHGKVSGERDLTRTETDCSKVRVSLSGFHVHVAASEVMAIVGLCEQSQKQVDRYNQIFARPRPSQEQEQVGGKSSSPIYSFVSLQWPTVELEVEKCFFVLMDSWGSRTPAAVRFMLGLKADAAKMDETVLQKQSGDKAVYGSAKLEFQSDVLYPEIGVWEPLCERTILPGTMRAEEKGDGGKRTSSGDETDGSSRAPLSCFLNVHVPQTVNLNMTTRFVRSFHILQRALQPLFTSSMHLSDPDTLSKAGSEYGEQHLDKRLLSNVAGSDAPLWICNETGIDLKVVVWTRPKAQHLQHQLDENFVDVASTSYASVPLRDPSPSTNDMQSHDREMVDLSFSAPGVLLPCARLRLRDCPPGIRAVIVKTECAESNQDGARKISSVHATPSREGDACIMVDVRHVGKATVLTLRSHVSVVNISSHTLLLKAVSAEGMVTVGERLLGQLLSPDRCSLPVDLFTLLSDRGPGSACSIFCGLPGVVDADGEQSDFGWAWSSEPIFSITGRTLGSRTSAHETKPRPSGHQLVVMHNPDVECTYILAVRESSSGQSFRPAVSRKTITLVDFVEFQNALSHDVEVELGFFSDLARSDSYQVEDSEEEYAHEKMHQHVIPSGAKRQISELSCGSQGSGAFLRKSPSIVRLAELGMRCRLVSSGAWSAPVKLADASAQSPSFAPLSARVSLPQFGGLGMNIQQNALEAQVAVDEHIYWESSNENGPSCGSSPLAAYTVRLWSQFWLVNMLYPQDVLKMPLSVMVGQRASSLTKTSSSRNKASAASVAAARSHSQPKYISKLEYAEPHAVAQSGSTLNIKLKLGQSEWISVTPIEEWMKFPTLAGQDVDGVLTSGGQTVGNLIFVPSAGSSPSSAKPLVRTRTSLSASNLASKRHVVRAATCIAPVVSRGVGLFRDTTIVSLMPAVYVRNSCASPPTSSGCAGESCALVLRLGLSSAMHPFRGSLFTPCRYISARPVHIGETVSLLKLPYAPVSSLVPALSLSMRGDEDDDEWLWMGCLPLQADLYSSIPASHPDVSEPASRVHKMPTSLIAQLVLRTTSRRTRTKNKPSSRFVVINVCVTDPHGVLKVSVSPADAAQIPVYLANNSDEIFEIAQVSGPDGLARSDKKRPTVLLHPHSDQDYAWDDPGGKRVLQLTLRRRVSTDIGTSATRKDRASEMELFVGCIDAEEAWDGREWDFQVSLPESRRASGTSTHSQKQRQKHQLSKSSTKTLTVRVHCARDGARMYLMIHSGMSPAVAPPHDVGPRGLQFERQEEMGRFESNRPLVASLPSGLPFSSMPTNGHIRYREDPKQQELAMWVFLKCAGISMSVLSDTGTVVELENRTALGGLQKVARVLQKSKPTNRAARSPTVAQRQHHSVPFEIAYLEASSISLATVLLVNQSQTSASFHLCVPHVQLDNLLDRARPLLSRNVELTALEMSGSRDMDQSGAHVRTRVLRSSGDREVQSPDRSFQDVPPFIRVVGSAIYDTEVKQQQGHTQARIHVAVAPISIDADSGFFLILKHAFILPLLTRQGVEDSEEHMLVETCGCSERCETDGQGDLDLKAAVQRHLVDRLSFVRAPLAEARAPAAGFAVPKAAQVELYVDPIRAVWSVDVKSADLPRLFGTELNVPIHVRILQLAVVDRAFLNLRPFSFFAQRMVLDAGAPDVQQLMRTMTLHYASQFLTAAASTVLSLKIFNPLRMVVKSCPSLGVIAVSSGFLDACEDLLAQLIVLGEQVFQLEPKQRKRNAHRFHDVDDRLASMYYDVFQGLNRWKQHFSSASSREMRALMAASLATPSVPTAQNEYQSTYSETLSLLRHHQRSSMRSSPNLWSVAYSTIRLAQSSVVFFIRFMRQLVHPAVVHVGPFSVGLNGYLLALRPPRGLAESGALVPFSYRRDSWGEQIFLFHREQRQWPNEASHALFALSATSVLLLTSHRAIRLDLMQSKDAAAEKSRWPGNIAQQISYHMAGRWTIIWEVLLEDLVRVSCERVELCLVAILRGGLRWKQRSRGWSGTKDGGDRHMAAPSLAQRLMSLRPSNGAKKSSAARELGDELMLRIRLETGQHQPPPPFIGSLVATCESEYAAAAVFAELMPLLPGGVQEQQSVAPPRDTFYSPSSSPSHLFGSMPSITASMQDRGGASSSRIISRTSVRPALASLDGNSPGFPRTPPEQRPFPSAFARASFTDSDGREGR
ncbi:hypothetical protein FVE85_3328 [Porphyridium purpureum]|uniref:Uncharacterized protein n=1 Tax=Porphyridium purpureum TaxID=35688 RepID=A0A5J4YX98_PORPP|nr:hypothetical protein FVE85_3328 [Porphyridium purpureum]|eukprot:POR7746..scf227_4